MPNSFHFDKDFCKEEVLWDYTVTEKSKKIWSVMLDITKEFARVCQKHDLKYMAAYGTLLGAVRHKGFIPWDDDIDFYMPRPDYEKLKNVAPSEFSEPYFFQNAHTDTIIWSFSKLRRSDTTAIQFPQKEITFNQGIFIDIFPIDDFPDGSNEKNMVYLMEKDLWTIITKPILGFSAVYQPNKCPYNFTLDRDIIVDLMKLSRPNQLTQFEDLCNSYYGTSPFCGNIMNAFRANNQIYRREWIEDTIMAPFENIEIPISAHYDDFLKLLYKDYMTPRIGGSCHDGMFIDAENPYTEYMNGNLKIPEGYFEEKNK